MQPDTTPDPPEPEGGKSWSGPVNDLLKAVADKFPDVERRDGLMVDEPALLAKPENVKEVATWLRDNNILPFNLCRTVTGNDKVDRFEVVYNLAHIPAVTGVQHDDIDRLALIVVITDRENPKTPSLIDLWKSAARFDPARASETTFVAMVARRRLIDLLRRTESRPKLVGMPEHLDAPDKEHQRIETGVEASSAARALASLKPEQRQVLLLSIYQGMSHGEIVEATGIPLGTVKSHIRRGLSEVRRKLGAEGEVSP